MKTLDILLLSVFCVTINAQAKEPIFLAEANSKKLIEEFRRQSFNDSLIVKLICENYDIKGLSKSKLKNKTNKEIIALLSIEPYWCIWRELEHKSYLLQDGDVVGGGFK